MTTRDELGYSCSQRFIGPDQFDRLPANELVFALRLAVKACNQLDADCGHARFEGAYVLQEKKQAPAIPVVYVISTDSETAARQIHQFVWNQNQTPFLIIESPTTIRLYSGFAFDREHDRPLTEVARDAAEQLERLAAFRAESIDDGTLWRQWAHAVDPKQRVDEKLLVDLRKLDRRLQDKEGLDRTASHGLIGKYVYLNYLRARGILSAKKLAKWEIDPNQLFTKHATLKAFRRVNDELQSWLNGSVFSLGDDALNEIKAEHLQLVARVFAGDSPKNMTEIQTTLFSVYDFAHIPIETLSCVYEQFLHDAKEEDDGTSRGKTLGAYYTPLPLADYVLSEMDHRHPLKPGMTVLDPACGSGAFLVQCYRRLIERQRREVDRELKASELRDLLTKHIFGIDRDDDACRVAELSLIMTLLDYIDPPDLEHTNFKLPSLRQQNIFQGDFFDTAGPVCELLSQQKFDWVVGNPPWAEVKGTPAADHEHHTAFQWMCSHAKTHPTSGNQLAEAFLWKSSEHLAKDGACGLVVLAMTWFKKEATTFRQRFFSSRRVWCLANFANLAYVLFAGRSERPASVVFFEHEPPDDDHVILTFAPFVAEQLANRPEQPGERLTTWNIVVSGAELREIEQSSAALGDSLAWKIAMWGTSRDRTLLRRIDGRFNDCKFDSLSKCGIGEPHQGFELRSGESHVETLKPAPELEGRKILDINKLRNARHLFSFPDIALPEIPKNECFIRIRGGFAGLEVSYPPHIVVDASRRFAVFSDEFIAVPPRQIGVAGTPESTNHLRALSLFLSSNFCVYHQFFNSPQWGIDANRADLNALLALPVPIARLSPADLADWSSLLDALIAATTQSDEVLQSQDPRTVQKLLGELNDHVYSLLGLRKSDRWLVEDFVNIHMELNKGKFTREVARAPTAEERLLYLTSLRECLDDFFATDRGVRHKIEVLTDRESALMAVSLAKSKTAIEPVVINADDPASRDLKIIRDQLRTKHSQWVYFDRHLKVYDPQQGVLYQFKPLQRLHWTRRQAVLDADDIIAETLSEGGES
ncbi:MAG: class I SAM-dependent DNA methyltransferase [Planctomycetaceae bacterium]